jgi:endonuclease YncB( thermonuclease family)
MRVLAASVCAVVLAMVGASAQRARPTDLVGRTFDAHVVGVIDGDTIDVVQAPNRRIRVRLDGVDTPEAGEPFSQQARTLARVLAFDKIVTIIGKDVDRYGRLVARVRADGRDLSIEMVGAGLACHFLRYSSDRVLADAEARARALGLGFWAAGASKPRCVRLNAANTPSSDLFHFTAVFGRTPSPTTMVASSSTG